LPKNRQNETEPSDTLRVSLKSADGKELVTENVPRRFLPAKPVKLAVGKRETVELPSHLFHTRIGAVCLGLDSGIGWNWLTFDVPPGKYRLSLVYECKQKDTAGWHGKVQTEAVKVEVKSAK